MLNCLAIDVESYLDPVLFDLRRLDKDVVEKSTDQVIDDLRIILGILSFDNQNLGLRWRPLSFNDRGSQTSFISKGSSFKKRRKTLGRTSGASSLRRSPQSAGVFFIGSRSILPWRSL